jgi:hypothetical protein
MFNICRWHISFLGLALVCIAWLHSNQFYSIEQYRDSPLIDIEFLLLITIFIMLVLQLFSALSIFLEKRWSDLWMLIINVFIAVILTTAAISIDAPTLVYMT